MRIVIRGRDLPGRACCGLADVAVGVQRGREVVDLRPADADVEWTFELTDVLDRAGRPDVRGPFAQGRPGARFVYLSWAGVAPDGQRAMFRRAKLMLGPELIAAAAGRTLTGELGLTAADGTPVCAAVRPPAIEWTVRPRLSRAGDAAPPVEGAEGGAGSEEGAVRWTGGA